MLWLHQQKSSLIASLSSSTVLDAVNISDLEVSDLQDYQDSDSDLEHSRMLECEQERQEQGKPTFHAGLSNVSEGEISSSTNSSSAASLLDVLRAPRPSDLTRKRKLQCNPGKPKKATPSSCINSEPKGVKPQDRVKKYLNEYLSVSHGKLFCTACREELSLKSSSLANHLKSQKHK